LYDWAMSRHFGVLFLPSHRTIEQFDPQNALFIPSLIVS